MAKKTTYYDPQNGQHYYHGEKLGAANWAALESQKDESYINQYNYTPSYNAYRQYLEEERRRQEEEERRRELWQQEHISAQRQQVENGQSVANFDTQAARQKAEPRIRYEQAYDAWNAENPEYKNKSAAEKYSLFAKELDDQNKMADASQGYRDFYNRNKKDPEFQRMSDEEKQRQYMHYLDQTAQDNGTLPEEQRAEFTEYKYKGLSDKEKQVIDAFMRVEAEDFDDYKGAGQTQYADPTGRGAYSQNRYNEAQQAADSRKVARERTIEDVKAELKHLGWTDEQIETELPRYSELVGWNKIQEDRKKYEEIATDPNLSGFEKAMVGAGYTAADWLSFIPGSIDTAIGYATGDSAYGRNTSTKHQYMRRMAEEGTSQVRNNLIGEDHPIAQQAYDIGTSWGESMSTKLLGMALGSAGEELALLPFAISSSDTAYRDAVNRGFSEKQAEGYAVTVGALEALTEKLPFDMWQDLIKDKKLGRSIITTALMQMGAEAGEEAVNEIGSQMADQIAVKIGKTGKTQAQIDIENLMAQGMSQEEAQAAWGKQFAKQVGMAALSGALSAAPDVAVGVGIRSYRSKYGNNLTQAVSDRYKNLEVKGDTAYENKLREDKAKYENNPTQYIADNFKVKSEDDAKIKAGLEQIAEKEREGKKLSVSDKSFITENVLANSDQFNQEFLDNLYDTGEDSVVPYKYRDVKTEVTEDQARTMLAEAAKAGDAQAFIDAQRKVRNSTIEDVANRAEELIDFYSGMAVDNGITKEDIGKALIAEKQAYIAGLKGEQLDKSMLTNESQIAYNDGRMDALNQKVRTTIDTTDSLKTDVTTKDGSTVKLEGVFTSDGIQTSDGTVSLDNLDLDENKAANKAYAFADNYESVNVKNNFLNNIKDGQNIENYNRDYGRVYDSALAGLSLESVKKESLNELDEDQIENIYETAVVERQARAAESFAEVFNGTKGKGQGKAFNESTSTDPKMLKIASMLARGTKYDIHLVDEVPQNKSAKGAFVKNENAIYVRADDFMRTLGHEFSHYIETYNKSEYDSLRNAVANFAANKMGSDAFMRAVDQYRGLYKTKGKQQLSASDISGEMFNDIVPIILESKQGSKALARYLAENYGAEEAKSFGEKIKEVIDNLAGTIKNYLSNADHNTPYAKEMRKYADELGQYADQFIKALDGAIQNYNNAVQGESIAEQKESTKSPKTILLSHADMNENAEKVRKMKSVGNVEFQHFNLGKKLSENAKIVMDHAQEEGWDEGFYNETAGYVDVNLSGMSDIMRHKPYEYKAAIIDIIPDVVKKGLVVAADINHKKRVYNTAVLVAPVTFTNSYSEDYPSGEYYAAVSLRRNKNLKGEISQRLHVIDAQIISKEDLDTVGSLDNKTRTQSNASPLNLRQIIEHVIAGVNIYGDNSTEKVNYSLSEDSTGRELSEGQKEYFEKSQVVDAKGNLLPLYHQTANDFTVFDPNMKGAGSYDYETPHGIFLKPDARDIGIAGKKQMELYANITNPLHFDNREKAKNFFKKNIPGYAEAVKEIENVDKDYHEKLMAEEEEENKRYAELFPKKKDMSQEEWVEAVEDIAKPAQDILNEWHNAANVKSEKAKKMVDDWFAASEFDGMILENDAGSFGRSVKTYIAFAPNQVKNVNNLNPTKKDDVRFSLDSDGNAVSEEKEAYFANSTIRDKAGHIKVMYHGSPNRFTVFDPMKMGGKNGIAEGYGIYFADNPEVSQSYGNEQMKGYLNVEKPARYNKKTISVNELVKLIKATAEKEAQENYEDEGYDTPEEAVKDSWVSNYANTYEKSMNAAYRETAEKIIKLSSSDMEIIRDVMQGQGIRSYDQAYDFYKVMTDTLGIDGFISEWNNSDTKEKDEIVVALYSNQFKNIDNEHPTKNPDVRWSLGGIGAFMADIEGMDKAREMEKEGKNKEEIWQETGWYRGADGKWRFEIDDSDVEVTDFEKTEYEKDKGYYLPEILKNEALYKAYPMLRSIDVYIKDIGGNTYGYYSKNNNAIYLDDLNTIKGLMNYRSPQEVLKSVLLHEIQHIIQDYEHFARGSSPEEWKKRMLTKNEIVSVSNRLKRKYKQKQRHYLELRDSLPVDLTLGYDKAIRLIREDSTFEQGQKLFDELEEKYGDLYSAYEDAMWEKDLAHDDYINSDPNEALSPYEAYRLTAGEVEARQVEERMNMSKEERKKSIPKTETNEGVLFIENEENPWEAPDVKWSLSEDSEGRQLTEGQQRYFNKSQALDEEGRLLELYHGSEAQAFSVFSTPGIWVTPDKELATEYAGEWNNWRNETEGYGKIKYETNGMEPEVYGDKYLRMYKVYANVTNPVSLGELNRTLPDDYAGMEMDNFGIKTEEQFDRLYDLVQEHLGDKIWQLTETKEFIDLMKELGYDGMFASENGHRTICVFDSNQLKNINNLNPTSSKDIRYALDLAEEEGGWVDFDAELGTTSEEEKAVDILAKGMEAMKNKEVDVPKLRSLAIKLRNEYGSTYNVNKLTEDLEKAFAYMQTEDHVDYPTMMGILRDIARPVIEEAGEKVGEEEYKNFIDYFKGKKIKLTQTQKDEVVSTFGSYGKFRNAIMPITISDNGDYTLDQLWDEMVQASGYKLDIDASEGAKPANLYDTLQAMKPYVSNDFGGDTEDLSKDLAMRIVEEYIEGEASKQMHKQLNEYRDKLKKDYNKRLEDLKGRANAEVLARNKKKAEQAKERQEARDLKHKIRQNANKLYTWAAKPTEGKSVPHNMIVPVMQFLQAIDFVDPVVTVSEDGKYHIRLFDHMDYEDGHKKFIYKDLVGDTREDVIKQFYEAVGRGQGSKEQRSWTDKMQGIRDIYNKVLNDTDFEDTSMDYLMQTLDAQGLAEEFDDMLSRHKGQLDMNNLTAKELKLINNVITNIFHAVNQGNKAYSMNADITNLAQDTIKESEGKTLKNRGKYSQMIHDFLRIDNATPVTFFDLLGKGASKIYGALRNGLNQEILDIKKASEFMKGIMKEVDKKEVQKWTGKKATVHEFNLTNGSIKMTDAQIMGLYLTIRRTGGMERIKGGIKVGDIKQNGKTINQDVIHLTDGDIKQIESVLTPEQISLAQKMQKYMAVDCSAQGNETSMKLYGYKKFTDPTYYPWTVDKDTVATTNTSENIPMFNSLERSGFTKQLKEGAKNPLVINDIFDVFTDHVSQMAGYHGYAASLKDTLRWMNYREMAPQDGGFVRYITNKNAINVLSGSKKGVGYIRDLMLDINKARKSDYIGNVTEALMGNYKAAAVGANARVVMQQPTAYLRALNIIDPQYLMAVNPATAIKNIKKSQEECPISWWKSKGYYETNLGQPLKEIVTGITSPTEKAKDVMMAPAGYADDVTWGFLYTAVEKEQRAKFRGQNVSAEEYRKAVNARFDELVDTTQVIDSALHRSAYMRSKDKLNILQTAFMAEPTKTYNMIMKAVIEDAREGKTMKRTSRAAIAFLLTAIFNAAAQSIPDVWRHAGDDDDYWEKFMEYLQSNFTDNINPLNLLPIVKDIAPEILNFGDSTWSKSNSRFDIDAVTTLFKDATSLYKYFFGESNKTGYGALMSFLRPLSQITGIPIYNLTRDTVSIYNAFFDNLETTVNNGTTRKNEKKKSFVTDVNREKSEDTLDEGIVDAIESGVSIYDLKGAVRSEYKNKYFDAYSEGNTEEAQAIAERAARAYARMGMSDEDIDAEINEWQEETITYALLDKAIASGEGIEDEIRHVQEGKADDKIIKHIMDRFSDTIAYEDVHETESDWRGNVEKALQAIDPTLTYDTANEEAMQKKAEKEAEQAAQEEKKGYKADFFASVESKNGTAGRKALDNLKAMGVDAKSAKAMVSTQYHDAWKEAKTPAEKQKAKSDWMSAYKLVCNYYGVESKDLEKTWSDWEKKQEEQ